MRHWVQENRLVAPILMLFVSSLLVLSTHVVAQETLRIQPGVKADRQLTVTPTPQLMVPTPQKLTVLSASPVTITQGTQTYLVITGQGFVKGMKFDFGPGISLLMAPTIVGSTQATVSIAATQSATPGSRPIKASVVIADRLMTTSGPAVLIVMQAPVRTYSMPVNPSPDGNPDQSSSSTSQPTHGGFGINRFVQPKSSILSIQPNILQRGKTYDLTLYGQNLNPNMKLDLGSGISATSAPIVTNTSTASLHVQVNNDAVVGVRNAKLQSGIGGTWVIQTATLQVQSPQFVTQTNVNVKIKPKIPRLDLHGIRQFKGVITQIEPQWHFAVSSNVPPKGPDGKPIGQPTINYKTDIPIVNDDTLLTWKEQNPGMADRFEVRFYVKGKLVKKVQIKPVNAVKNLKILPTWYRPSGPVLASVLAKVPNRTSSGKYQVSLNSGFVGKNKSDLGKALAKADIAWEVAGFRTYHKSGVTTAALNKTSPFQLAANHQGLQITTDVNAGAFSGGADKPVDVEVELSQRWPLRAPDKPTGFDCSKMKGQLDLVNIDRKTSKKGKNNVQIDTVDHTQDRFQLSGTIGLSKSPYATHATTKQTTVHITQTSGYGPFGHSSSHDKIVATSWQFENIFIDWGDGTVEPLIVNQNGDKGAYKNGMSISLDNNKNKFQHAYSEVGDYSVRVYQLSSDDIQSGSQQVVSYATGSMSGSLYAQAAKFGGANSNAVPEHTLNIARAVADRAYLLFCKHVHIQPRHDPFSDGPLHLVKIEVQGFPGAASTSDLTMYRASSPGTVGLKPAQAQFNNSQSSSGKGNAGAITVTNNNSLLNKQATSELVADAKNSAPIYGRDQQGLPAFTACDVSMTAGARLSYYGKGRARLRWFLDGQQVYQEERDDIGPSLGRSDLQLAKLEKARTGNSGQKFMAIYANQPRVDTLAPLKSSPINLDTIGKHNVTVSAEVIPALNQLYQYASQAMGVHTGKPSATAAGQIMNGLQPKEKIGVLSPFTHATRGIKPVSYLNKPLTRLAQQFRPLVFAKLELPGKVTMNDALNDMAAKAPKQGPPDYVISKPSAYRVVGFNKNESCTFEFPVQGGHFLITGLQKPGGKTPNVSHKGHIFTGKGDLNIFLPDSNGALKQTKIPIHFANWTLDKDSVKVLQGSLAVSKLALGDMPLPGLIGTVTALSGKAGDHLDATLNLRLSNQQLTMSAAPDKVAAWANLKAPLSPQGDWIYANAPKMGKTNIYGTPFTIEPNKVTLDLSTVSGDGAQAACSGKSDKAWMGVHLGKDAQVSVFNFDVAGDVFKKVDNWGIDAAGLCGTDTVGTLDKLLQKGKVHWDSVKLTAQHGDFKATYNGMWVKVPWLDTKLQAATAPVISNDGKVSLSLTGDAPSRTYGDITMQAKNLLFTFEKGVGWVARSDTQFNFAGEGQSFAKDVVVDDLLFGMDGKAYFKEGGGNKTVNLAGKSGHVGLDIANHKSVLVTAVAGPSERLRFDFSTALEISKTLPNAKATVDYAIVEQDNKYSDNGPFMTIEPITKPFPDAQPSVTVKIAPSYSPSISTNTARNDNKLLDWMIPNAQASTGHVRYYGNVDFGMLGVDALAGVTGEFVLGDYQGSDYWATKVLKDLPSGIPVFPPMVSLYQVGGGLGYNVALNVCEGQSLKNITPKIDGQAAFFAQGLFGSPDGFAYKLRGCLTVKPSEGARMDYDAWLLNKSYGGIDMLSSSSSAKGDFYGYFQYAGGSFDGTLNGKYAFLDNQAYVEAANNAIKLHFANDAGYIHVGSKTNPVTGHVFIVDANAYAGVDLYPTPGLKVGASAHKKLTVGTCDSDCGVVSGDIVLDAAVTAQPKMSFHNNLGLNVKGCLGECASASVGVDIKGSAAVSGGGVNTYLGFSTGFGGCPTPDVTIGLRVLPTPKPDVSIDWCDLSSLL